MSSAKQRFKQLYKSKLAQKQLGQSGGGLVYPDNKLVNAHRDVVVQQLPDYICFKRDALHQIGRALIDAVLQPHG